MVYLSVECIRSADLVKGRGYRGKKQMRDHFGTLEVNLRHNVKHHQKNAKFIMSSPQFGFLATITRPHMLPQRKNHNFYSLLKHSNIGGMGEGASGKREGGRVVLRFHSAICLLLHITGTSACSDPVGLDTWIPSFNGSLHSKAIFILNVSVSCLNWRCTLL